MMKHIPLLVPDAGKNVVLPSGKMLVVMHLHAPELATEMLASLNTVPMPIDLVVTTSREDVQKVVAAGKKPENLEELHIVMVPNRGRDIAPWLHALPPEKHLQYDIALKIHGKKSAEAPDGDLWRKFLLQSLLGDRATVSGILGAMRENPFLGLVIPTFPPDILLAKPHAFEWNRRDLALCRKILTDRGIEVLPERNETPLFGAGSMFYYRPAALAKLLKNPPPVEKFPQEPLPRIGTLAHALERVPAFIARAAHYEIVRVLPKKMLEENFLRYENAFLTGKLPIQPTISGFLAAVKRSIAWRLLKK